jgi:hypothetical protein
MTATVPQSTALLVVFRAFLATDGKTPATGKTIAITISKNGGAFGNPSAGATNATEISSGWYKVTLSTTDTATAGPLAVRGAEGTIDDVGLLYYVEANPETGYGVNDLIKTIAAATAGKVSGAGTTTITIRDITDSRDAIVATVDADGNRSAVTVDLTN